MSHFFKVLQTFPTLHSERLLLREPSTDDAERYFALISTLPRVSSWSDSAEASSLENARKALLSYRRQFELKRETIPWIVEYEGQLAGFLKIFVIQNQTRGEVGYWMGQEFAGQGLMTEALRRAADFAFQDLHMHRLYGLTSPNNIGSHRVLEKAGFRPEGVLRQHTLRQGIWQASLVYGRLAEDAPEPLKPVLSLNELSDCINSSETEAVFRTLWKQFLELYTGRTEFLSLYQTLNGSMERVYSRRVRILRKENVAICGADETLEALQKHLLERCYIVGFDDSIYWGLLFLSEDLRFARAFMYFRYQNL